MGRSRNDQRLDEIRDEIQDNPGQRAGRVARDLEHDNKTVQRALSQLEDRGDLLWEDDQGGLHWFGRRG